MSVAGARVLVLEDEPIIGLALEDQLTDRGAMVIVAARIEEALEILDGTQIDLAILDVNVHGVPSYAVAHVLGQRAIRYIFATGYGDLSHPPEFAAIPTVSKPYSVDEIERALG